jgi:hypothetical protein
LAGRFRSALNALFGRASSGGPGGYASPTSGGPNHPDAFGAKYQPSDWKLVEAYKSLIFFAVNLNANAVARIPLKLYARQRKGEPEPRRSGGVVGPRAFARFARSADLAGVMAGAKSVHVIAEHPHLDALGANPYFDRRQILDLTCRYLDVVGAAYLRPVMAGAFLAEWWPLQSQNVYPVTEATSALIREYRYFNDTFPFEGLLRLRWPSLKNPFSAHYSPTHAAIQYAGIEDKFASLTDQVFGLGPRPEVVVSPSDWKMPLSADQRKLIEQDLDRKHSRGRAGRWWVQMFPTKVDVVSYKPTDVGGKVLAEYMLERILNCFGIPVAYASSETNLANLEASHRYHADNGIEPRCDLIASGLTSFSSKADPRLFWGFDSPLAEDEERDANVTLIRVGGPVTTPNEARAEKGQPPVEGGDELMFPSTMTPLSRLVEEPEPDAEQQGQQQGQGQEQDDDQGDAGDAERSAFLGRLGSFLDGLEADRESRRVRRAAPRRRDGGDRRREPAVDPGVEADEEPGEVVLLPEG